MKRALLVFLSITMISLLLVPIASAQGPDGRDRPMQAPMTHDHGFDGGYGEMNITGEVYVDEAITIQLNIAPNQEMIDRMENMDHDGMGHMPDNNMPENMNPEDMMNTISVQIWELVEFVDVDNNGYSVNDTVVSTFALNSSTLLEPVVTEGDNGTVYTIDSADDSFTMYLYLNEEDGIPHSWKWSLDFSYNFLSEDTEVAITQSVTSNGQQPMMPHQNQIMHQYEHGSMTNMPVEGQLNVTRLQDEHQDLPMFFKWDETANVDGVIENITASIIDGMIAISIPQGNHIFYDPEIGIEVDVLAQVDSILSTISQGFSDIINSPTALGLILAVTVIGSFVAITRFKK